MRTNLTGLVAVILVFSIPILSILRPVLRDMVPLLYILAIAGVVTLSARHLMGFRHSLRLEELERQKELALIETERYREAERLIAADDPVENKVRQIERKRAATTENGD